MTNFGIQTDGSDQSGTVHTDLISRDPLIGAVVADKFKISTVLGTGAWGRVYQARDLNGDKDIALKALHLHLVADQNMLLRFQREARSGFNLKHPNICEVFSQGVLPTGQPFIVMEYLRGENLASLLRTQGVLSAREAISVFLGCALGLKGAQDQGIVHRDIKPANIFLTGEAESAAVKLLDFGMAKIVAEHNDLTQTGTGFGTIYYMSPEQVLGESVDTRSDIYALGCVMYEALSGRKVFSGKGAYQIMDQHVRELPAKLRNENGNIPLKLESIVLKALSKLPCERFQTAEELIDNLVGAE